MKHLKKVTLALIFFIFLDITASVIPPNLPDAQTCDFGPTTENKGLFDDDDGDTRH